MNQAGSLFIAHCSIPVKLCLFSVHNEVVCAKMYQPGKGKMSVFLIVEKIW